MESTSILFLTVSKSRMTAANDCYSKENENKQSHNVEFLDKNCHDNQNKPLAFMGVVSRQEVDY